MPEPSVAQGRSVDSSERVGGRAYARRAAVVEIAHAEVRRSPPGLSLRNARSASSQIVPPALQPSHVVSWGGGRRFFDSSLSSVDLLHRFVGIITMCSTVLNQRPGVSAAMQASLVEKQTKRRKVEPIWAGARTSYYSALAGRSNYVVEQICRGRINMSNPKRQMRRRN